MDRVIKHKEYLSLLGTAKRKEKRNLLIDFASNADIKAIAEIIFNLLHGTFPLTDREKRTLRRYQQVLRAIAKKSNSYKIKRNLLKQHGGGFLSFLIPAALSAAVSAVTSILEK